MGMGCVAVELTTPLAEWEIFTKLNHDS